MYLVALFKDEKGVCSELSFRDSEKRGDSIKFEEEYLKSLGYKLVLCVITNDWGIYHKAKLKVRLEELRSLDPNTDYYGYDDTLMKSIGFTVNRLIRKGYEVTDELALQCKDYRDKWIAKKEEEKQELEVELIFEDEF